MDLLFSRYASPHLLIDTVVEYGRFQHFVSEMFEAENDRIQWEYWLHRIYGKSYAEYREDVEEHGRSYAMTDGQVKAQLQSARSILRGFKI